MQAGQAGQRAHPRLSGSLAHPSSREICGEIGGIPITLPICLPSAYKSIFFFCFFLIFFFQELAKHTRKEGRDYDSIQTINAEMRDLLNHFRIWEIQDHLVGDPPVRFRCFYLSFGADFFTQFLVTMQRKLQKDGSLFWLVNGHRQRINVYLFNDLIVSFTLAFVSRKCRYYYYYYFLFVDLKIFAKSATKNKLHYRDTAILDKTGWVKNVAEGMETRFNLLSLISVSRVVATYCHQARTGPCR